VISAISSQSQSSSSWSGKVEPIIGSFVSCSLTHGSNRSEEEVRGTRVLCIRGEDLGEAALFIDLCNANLLPLCPANIFTFVCAQFAREGRARIWPSAVY
jgi:hypothetical protein